MNKRFFLSIIFIFFTLIITFISIKLINRPTNPVDMVNENTETLKAEKQIMFNEFNENDFTCTGMTYDTKNNSIWIADYGAENDNNELNPRLLELDYEYKNVINIINLKNIMDNSFNLQGISYDEIDNSLWLATGDYIYEINKNGDIIQKYSMGKYSKYKSNGIFVDNDKIWILCYKKYLLCLNREGDFINKYKFNFMVKTIFTFIIIKYIVQLVLIILVITILFLHLI